MSSLSNHIVFQFTDRIMNDENGTIEVTEPSVLSSKSPMQDAICDDYCHLIHKYLSLKQSISQYGHQLNDRTQASDFLLFRSAWVECEMSAIHHCCPKKADPILFLQLIFSTIIKLIYDDNGKFDIHNTSMAEWNQGVIFALYCTYYTQIVLSTTSTQQKYPIRISFDDFVLCLVAVEEISAVSIRSSNNNNNNSNNDNNNNIDDSNSIIDSTSQRSHQASSEVTECWSRLLSDRAFLHSLFTGPSSVSSLRATNQNEACYNAVDVFSNAVSRDNNKTGTNNSSINFNNSSSVDDNNDSEGNIANQDFNRSVQVTNRHQRQQQQQQQQYNRQQLETTAYDCIDKYQSYIFNYVLCLPNSITAGNAVSSFISVSSYGNSDISDGRGICGSNYNISSSSSSLLPPTTAENQNNAQSNNSKCTLIQLPAHGIQSLCDSLSLSVDPATAEVASLCDESVGYNINKKCIGSSNERYNYIYDPTSIITASTTIATTTTTDDQSSSLSSQQQMSTLRVYKPWELLRQDFRQSVSSLNNRTGDVNINNNRNSNHINNNNTSSNNINKIVNNGFASNNDSDDFTVSNNAIKTLLTDRNLSLQQYVDTGYRYLKSSLSQLPPSSASSSSSLPKQQQSSSSSSSSTSTHLSIQERHQQQLFERYQRKQSRLLEVQNYEFKFQKKIETLKKQTLKLEKSHQRSLKTKTKGRKKFHKVDTNDDITRNTSTIKISPKIKSKTNNADNSRKDTTSSTHTKSAKKAKYNHSDQSQLDNSNVDGTDNGDADSDTTIIRSKKSTAATSTRKGRKSVNKSFSSPLTITTATTPSLVSSTENSNNKSNNNNNNISNNNNVFNNISDNSGLAEWLETFINNKPPLPSSIANNSTTTKTTALSSDKYAALVSKSKSRGVRIISGSITNIDNTRKTISSSKNKSCTSKGRKLLAHLELETSALLTTLSDNNMHSENNQRQQQQSSSEISTVTKGRKATVKKVVKTEESSSCSQVGRHKSKKLVKAKPATTTASTKNVNNDCNNSIKISARSNDNGNNNDDNLEILLFDHTSSSAYKRKIADTDNYTHISNTSLNDEHDSSNKANGNIVSNTKKSLKSTTYHTNSEHTTIAVVMCTTLENDVEIIPNPTSSSTSSSSVELLSHCSRSNKKKVSSFKSKLDVLIAMENIENMI